MASKLYFRQALTGGTTNALDGIDGAVLADQDACIVFHAGNTYHYSLDAASGQAESSPDIIAPDIDAGNKRWILQNVFAAVGELGTAATADIGTLPENVPTNADLGTAAMKDVEGDGGTVVETQNLGTAARQADTRYAHRSNNLSDLANISTARNNLGLGTAATADIGVDVQEYIKHNLTATGAPTANDDTSVGYQVGSVWIDTSASPKEAYRCVDATAGAAVWVNTSLEIGELGTLANQDKNNVAITGGDIDADTVDFTSEYDNGVVSANATIDWANGNDQKITLGASITLTFSNMGVGHKQLKVIQDATGGRIPTLPAGKWPGGTAGSFSTAAGAEDILSVYYDGASYYFQLVKGWA